MLADCGGPIWGQDDFSLCLQRDFLQVLFPLSICAISGIFLLIQLNLHIIPPKGTTDGYIKPSELPHQYAATADSLDNSGMVGNGHGGDLDLIPQQKESPVVEVNHPWGETTSVALEVAVSLGQVGIHAAAVVLQAWGRDGRVAATAELVTWSYITLLACTRLVFTGTKRSPRPNIWNHTAILYGFQWIFTLFLFRSALIHPNSNQTKALVSTDFGLVSILFLVSIISRKGNNPVILEFEDDLEPSREPLASLLSLATFSWVDVIVWKGYKKTFELSDVWNLAPKDRATKVLEDFRQLRRTSRLAWRLFKYFKWELFYQACWALFGGFLTFVPTLLLKAILEYVENPQSIPASTGWLYVILLALSGIVSAVADGQALWIGRKICIRLRAIIIGEIYHKTLKRKAAASSDKLLGQGTEKKQDSKLRLKAKIVSLWRRNKTEQPPQSKDQQKVDSQTNAGTIINLMAVDAQKISEICAYLHFLFPSTPVQIIIAFTLLYQVMGYSSIVGIAIMLLLMPVNFVISNQFSVMQKKIMAATDGRIHSTNEVLSNIRIIKYFAWEQRFQHIVNDKRAIELRATRNKFILWTGASIVWYGVPLIVTTLSFLVYTVVEKKDLIPSVAFTALSLFSLLRYPLDRIADMMARVQASKVSVDRVDEFLNEDETEKFIQLSHEPRYENGQMVIGFDKATFTWGGKDMPDDKQAQMFRMINLDIRFQVGHLNIVAGSTGSGKTSLLMALLGEMTLLDGSVYLPGGYSREKLRSNPETGLTESVAYCAQQAWLVNADIKHNIVFASPWDSQRYESVIEACALRRDLEVLEAGDQTLVGEKGIVVSGGQKQRISLARALYCNAKHVLLDDCLSAVDSHTAQHIFLEAIKGPLMLNRTCILVTHNVGLCVPKSSHVVVLANGKITAQGPPEVIMSTGALGTELSRPASRDGTEAPTRTQSTENLEHKAPTETNGHTGQANGHLNGSAQDSTAKSKAQNNIGEAKVITEAKSEGSVKWRVIQMYLAAMGSWYFWICIPIAFACETLAGLAPNVWIRQWANSYSTKQTSAMGPYNVPFNFEASSIGASVYTSHSWINFPIGGSAMSNASSANPLLAASGPSMAEVGYYLGIYVLLGLVYLCFCVFRLSISFKGSLNASRSIHAGLLEAITRAKFKFFDTTPLGQITNRFSTDLSTIDQDTNAIACGFLQGLFNGFAIVLLISIITPGFLVAGAFLTLIYFCIGMFYINSSRDLKRLESVQRSPLYQQFGETLSGITTIRAYGDEDRFIRENAAKVNNYNRPFIYLWSTNRWLAFRVDFAGALVSFFAATFIILNVNTIDSGAAGLSLTYALLFNENILWLVRLYGQNEQNMNCVERVKEYMDVEQEAKAQIPENKPASNWPSHGAVQFINYTTRYREDLAPVLKKLSFSIKAEEKVGIVGRTGAGKSSLALALFRGLEATEGKILIDDVDIGLIGLQDLRESITIVPQDPTLFTGTVRDNLDPFGLFTDEEIFTALRQVHLIGSPPSTLSLFTSSEEDPITVPSTSRPAPSSQQDPDAKADLTRIETNSHENVNVFLNLSSPISESGSNLSQGQRQLLCLARALLKSPRVLMMDEATASIDYATDAKIQDTLRELKGSTIITIAHRLQTIIDYDKVLVLDKGEVIEFDAPWELIKRQGGIFRGMCEMNGDFGGLLGLARKAEEKNKLVDV